MRDVDLEIGYGFRTVFEWFDPSRDTARTDETGVAILKAAKDRDFVVFVKDDSQPTQFYFRREADGQLHQTGSVGNSRALLSINKPAETK